MLSTTAVITSADTLWLPRLDACCDGMIGRKTVDLAGVSSQTDNACYLFYSKFCNYKQKKPLPFPPFANRA